MSLPAWREIDDRLREWDAPVSAAESHGLLCGLLCTRVGDAQGVWMRRTFDDEAAPSSAPVPLDSVYERTLAQLDDTAFGFELLLPADDEIDLPGRTAALADWCNGFAFGVGASGWTEDRLPAESREFLHDAARIAQAEVQGQGDDEDEAAFAEVAEYVRMGTLLMRTECAG